MSAIRDVIPAWQFVGYMSIWCFFNLDKRIALQLYAYVVHMK